MAKLDARRVAAFLTSPGSCLAVLLHGSDAGLARERAETLLSSVLGSARDDPFRLTDLTRDEAARPGILAAEAAALSMTGGRRIVRLRETTDAHAGPVQDALAVAKAAGDPGTLLLLEAGDLTARSKLRILAEAAPEVVAIECRREREDTLPATIAAMLGEKGVQADGPVLAWLAPRLGEDRLLLRRAVEVLTLQAGPGGRLDEDMAQACVGEGPAADLDAALLAATAGKAVAADAALDAALAEGANPVMVVRAALRHVQRLHEVALAGGDQAGLRPPVFFRHKPDFDKAVRVWTVSALEAQGMALLEVERRLKTTAFREMGETLVRASLGALARQAATLSRR